MQPLIEATALTGMNPTDLEPIFPQDIELVWDEVENAKYYLVQLSIVESFGVVIYDSIVTSNALTIDELQFDNRDHYWRVKVFTDYEFCSDWLEGSGSFTPDESVGAHEAIAKDWKLYPTVLERGAELYLEARSSIGNLTVNIFNSVGQLASEQKSDKEGVINVSSLETGIYLVNISDGVSQHTQKIIIQ